MEEKKRQSSFELLRIIAMCMIITRHYMTKGGVICELYEDITVRNTLGYLLDAFCMVCCNVYVLISGYFMVDGNWKISKVIKLVAEVLFYSILIPIVLGAFGIINLSELDFGQLITILLPIEQEHYWFATAYVGLFLISPILAAAVNNVSKETLRNSIIGLLIMYGGFKSINPYKIPNDRYGEDIVWFICLFLIAGYIKRYGIKCLDSVKRCLATYVGATLIGFGICLICAIIASRTGKLWYYMDMTYSNNYVTVLIASVALFCLFTYIDISNVIINKLAACTFGVYLIHNHSLIAYHWQKWLGIDLAMGKWWQPLHLIISIVVVFVIGALVDTIRAGIFRAFGKIKS